MQLFTVRPLPKAHVPVFLPLSNLCLFSYNNIKIELEKWPSGRRRSPAKGVSGLSRIEGSNPSFSAMT